MQVLYQIDVTGETDRDALSADLDDAHDPPEVRDAALDLALAAWAEHDQADQQVATLAPDWPTHRQPPVDRAILRLAYHEIASGRSPATIAINEAIELAKAYASERAPAFINGVLDKMAKRIEPRQTPRAVESQDTWLDDALHERP